MFTVVGPRIRVKIDERKEEKSSGGIIMVDPSKHVCDADIGEVVGIGTTAYKNMDDEQPWCKIGDKVLFQRHAGKEDPTDPTGLHRYLKDIDVIAVDAGESDE